MLTQEEKLRASIAISQDCAIDKAAEIIKTLAKRAKDGEKITDGTRRWLEKYPKSAALIAELEKPPRRKRAQASLF